VSPTRRRTRTRQAAVRPRRPFAIVDHDRQAPARGQWRSRRPEGARDGPFALIASPAFFPARVRPLRMSGAPFPVAVIAVFFQLTLRTSPSRALRTGRPCGKGAAPAVRARLQKKRQKESNQPLPRDKKNYDEYSNHLQPQLEKNKQNQKRPQGQKNTQHTQNHKK